MDESMKEGSRQSIRAGISGNLGTLVQKVTGLETLVFQLSNSLLGPKPSESTDKKGAEIPCDFVGEIRQSLGYVRDSIDRSAQILEQLNQEFRKVK